MRKKITYSERWATHSKFFAIEGVVRGFVKYRGIIPGCENRDIVCVGRNGDLRVYYSSADIERSKRIGYAFISKTQAVKKFINQSKAAQRRYLAVSAKIYRSNLEQYANPKIFSLFRELFDAYTKVVSYYRITSAEFYELPEQEIKDSLRGHVSNVTRAYLLLTEPESTSQLLYSRELQNWSRIIVRARQKGISSVKALLQNHAVKFGFLGAGGGSPFGWDHDYFLKKFRMDLKRHSLTVKRGLDCVKSDRNTVELKKRFIRINKLPHQVVLKSRLISDLTFLRMRLREDITKAAFLSRPIFSLIYQKIEKKSGVNLEYEVLRQLNFQEIERFLLHGKAVNIARLKVRYRLYAYRLQGNHRTLMTGRLAKNFIRNSLALEKSSDKSGLLHGEPVYSHGVVYGRAFVIDNAYHSLKQQKLAVLMNKNDILVTGMTRPQILTACHKARAIVTDEGGITCHAAIVSRELRVPCVVGTSHGTATIKTGDWLRVDSDSGNIRIIKR